MVGIGVFDALGPSRLWCSLLSLTAYVITIDHIVCSIFRWLVELWPLSLCSTLNGHDHNTSIFLQDVEVERESCVRQRGGGRMD